MPASTAVPAFGSAEAHLLACEKCAAELAGLRESLTLFRVASTAHADNELRQMPRVSLTARSTLSPAIEPTWWVTAAAIFLAAILPMQSLRQHSMRSAPAVSAATASDSAGESDEALLEDVDRDTSVSVPTPMQALADPTDNISSTNIRFNLRTKERLTMIVRLARNPLFAFAAIALSGSIALAQQAPAPAPQPDGSAPAAAPIERQPPAGPRPDMMQGKMHRSPQMRDGDGFRGQDGGFRIGPMGMWWKNPTVVQRLSLTADQTKKMDDIFQQSRLQLIDLKANVEKQQVMLEPLLSANPLDTNKAMVQIDKVAQARADLEKANAKMLLNIRAVLTPDQWTKLRDRQFGGPGGQGGPGGPAAGGPGGPGGGSGSRSHGMHGGGPVPNASSNLMDPIDQP